MQITHSHTHTRRDCQRLPFARPTEAALPRLPLSLICLRFNVIVVIVFVVVAGKI